MDPVLFKAAAAGKFRPFENYPTRLDQLLTPDENTILHVYLENQRRESESTDFVDKILEMCSPLLLQANKKGEIPLHLAARYGHSNVVRVLIDRAKALAPDPESGVKEAKKMLRMTNEEQDTALHEAARNSQSYVVEILTKEDPEFPHSANVHGETPLYIAASRGTWVIDEILTNCISVDYGGPNGRTALHEAIRRGDKETARKLLDKKKTLTKTTDENGWSPLHYAAYYDCSGATLLQFDASAAYIAETEKKRTALHIAAIRGHVGIMKEIVSRCPDCCELVDNRGWNALHYAVASKRSRVFKECLENIPLLARLGTKKDEKGNTPFHLIAALARQQKQWELVLYEGELRGLNKRKLSVIDIYGGDFRETQEEILESLEDVGSGPLGNRVLRRKNVERNKEEEEAMSKARESHLVVAALIATVTFAAAFTLPGGYKTDQGPNEGTAILTKKTAFIGFIISNAISMVLSTFAVFIHFLISLIQGLELDKSKDISKSTTKILFGVATVFTMIGMGTMIIAFITGTYAVLEPSFGLAMNSCLIGLSFFFLVYLVFTIIYRDLIAQKIDL